MKKKAEIKKLRLNKDVITTLTKKEQQNLKGGWTTSYMDCTQVMLCCAETYYATC